MPFQEADCNMLSLEWEYPNEGYFYNVMHLAPAVEQTQAVCNAYALRLTQWRASLASGKAIQNENVKLVRAHMRDLRTEGEPLFTSAVTDDGGARDGGLLPINTALCITIVISHAGRSGRGRWYWGGIDRDAIDDDNTNFLVESFANDARSALGELTDKIKDETSQWPVVLSRYHDHELREPAATYLWRSFALRDYRVDSQRRRIARVVNPT